MGAAAWVCYWQPQRSFAAGGRDDLRTIEPVIDFTSLTHLSQAVIRRQAYRNQRPGHWGSLWRDGYWVRAGT